ncbi:hypothetical protein L6R52_28735 [Myxococcota bacterium]|nr:hypothetical protein [Myxococcota bacterium]
MASHMNLTPSSFRAVQARSSTIDRMNELKTLADKARSGGPADVDTFLRLFVDTYPGQRFDAPASVLKSWSIPADKAPAKMPDLTPPATQAPPATPATTTSKAPAPQPKPRSSGNTTSATGLGDRFVRGGPGNTGVSAVSVGGWTVEHVTPSGFTRSNGRGNW